MGKPTMTNQHEIEARLLRSLGREKERAKQLKKELLENYLSNFEWKAKPLFESLWLVRFYEDIFKRVKKHKTASGLSINLLEIVRDEIKGLELYLERDFNVRSYSTSELHNAASSWKYALSLNLKRELKSLIEDLA